MARVPRASPWLAGESLPERSQPLERGSRQRALPNRSQGRLELLRRCHTDQDDAYRRQVSARCCHRSYYADFFDGLGRREATGDLIEGH